MIGYWPLALYLLVAGAVMPSPLGSTPLARVALDGVVFLALPMAAVLLAYRTFVWLRDWKGRLFVIYAAWLVIAFLGSMLFGFGVGGHSMAAVDGGPVPIWQRYLQTLPFAAYFAGLAHVLFLPWVLIAGYLMSKVDERFHLWSDEAPSAE
ncbi:MAG: hypothetical protein ABEN55_13150 [Bradymonadaceae bacterium]